MNSKLIKVITLSALLFCLLSCSKENKYKNYETEKYSLSNSHIEENSYVDISGNNCVFPFLPGGLFFTNEVNELSAIDNQSRREDIGDYPVFNVLSVFDSDDYLIVLTSDKGPKIISKDETEIVKEYEDISTDGLVKIFDSEWMDKTVYRKYIQNAFSLQDKIQNKKYGVEYSTPVIDGITRIGLYEDKFYFGETIYSYFILDLKTDELKFFKDKKEYYDFCKDNINHSVEIIESAYLYN